MKLIIGRYQIRFERIQSLPQTNFTFMCEACNVPGACAKHDTTCPDHVDALKPVCENGLCGGRCEVCNWIRAKASESTKLIERKAA